MSKNRVSAFQALLPAEARTLVAIMSRIVPHATRALQDVVWDTALAYDAQLVANVMLRGDVRQFLRDLDGSARKTGADSFAGAEVEVQDTLLQNIEGSGMFQSLINATITDFYNRHVVWDAIGYPGVEQRDGAGYLHKGFDALKWH